MSVIQMVENVAVPFIICIVCILIPAFIPFAIVRRSQKYTWKIIFKQFLLGIVGCIILGACIFFYIEFSPVLIMISSLAWEFLKKNITFLTSTNILLIFILIKLMGIKGELECINSELSSRENEY